MAHEQIVIHGNDRPLFRAFRDQRQREMRGRPAEVRRNRALRDRAGVIGEAAAFQGGKQPVPGRKIGRAKSPDGGCRKPPPARRSFSIVVFPRRAQRGVELVKLLEPVRFAPVLAIEMAAAVAADLVARLIGRPDMFKPRQRFGLVLGKADIRAAGGMSWGLVGLAFRLAHQEGTGQEVGKARAAAVRHGQAALPQTVVMRPVKGNQHQLFRAFFRLGCDVDKAGERGHHCSGKGR